MGLLCAACTELPTEGLCARRAPETLVSNVHYFTGAVPTSPRFPLFGLGNVSHAKIWDGNTRRGSRVNNYDTLAVWHACVSATISWITTSIRTATSVEMKTGVSRFALRSTCRSTVVDLGLHLKGVKNNANCCPNSWRVQVFSLFVSLFASWIINVGTSGEL